jgi:hypothetical protein
MLREAPWRRVLGRFGLLVGAAAVVVVGVYGVFWPVSDLIARHDVGAISGPPRAAALQAARDAARGRLLTFGAGLFAAAALVYTARNFTLSRRTVELTEQGQVTERYAKAVEQLGSDKLDVRIGGIYALERIARDSARDHPTVMEVLSAFVRVRSRDSSWPPPELADGSDEPATRPDVQAAVTVIGRRDPAHDRGVVDLACAQLPGADLTGAELTDAKLGFTNLADVNLTRAKLGRADLIGANLTRADLTRADLTGADLTGADLRQTGLVAANLCRADLRGAKFAPLILTGADFTGAICLENFPVPEGWVRDPHSGRLARRLAAR